MKWWHVAAAVIVTAAATASCTREAEQPSAANTSDQACADNDIECRNQKWMDEFAEEERRQPKLPLDEIFGDWVVVAALEQEQRFAADLSVHTFAHRDVWLGAKVSLTPDAITLEPPTGAPVLRDDGSGTGDLYPRCTKPDFETKDMSSASPLVDYIELWQHFGFEKPAVGRPVLVRCNGKLEWPDDGSGDVAEVTVEEASAIEALYLYDRDHLIVQWGALEFLLRRKSRPTGTGL